MGHEEWSRAERERVRRAMQRTSDARLARRLLALLQVMEGQSVSSVARLMGFSRRALHLWLSTYRQHRSPAVLADRPRSGRPPSLGRQQRQYLRGLLSRSPQKLGLWATEWTVPLLQHQLEQQFGQKVGDDTLRGVLHQLGYVWKRPRYVLTPDPEQEKKTLDTRHAGLLAASGDGAHRGRDGPSAVSTSARWLGPARYLQEGGSVRP